eukprot:6180281-Pleurochrysis_carterae.AAC.1
MTLAAKEHHASRRGIHAGDTLQNVQESYSHDVVSYGLRLIRSWARKEMTISKRTKKVTSASLTTKIQNFTTWPSG